MPLARLLCAAVLAVPMVIAAQEPRPDHWAPVRFMAGAWEGKAQRIRRAPWIVSFMNYDLGYIDLEQKALHLWTTRSARGCHLCLRYDLSPM